MDADYDVSVTTTTLVRDSTLDSVVSPSCCLQPPTLLVDPSSGPVAPGSTWVHVVSTAANMEDWNITGHLLRDAAANSHCVAADDVIPEPEINALHTGNYVI